MRTCLDDGTGQSNGQRPLTGAAAQIAALAENGVSNKNEPSAFVGRLVWRVSRETIDDSAG